MICPNCMRLEARTARLEKTLQQAYDKQKQSPVQQMKNLRAEIQELRALMERLVK